MDENFKKNDIKPSGFPPLSKDLTPMQKNSLEKNKRQINRVSGPSNKLRKDQHNRNTRRGNKPPP